ncbi:RrF2 family transcriptional regulator [Negadavirga shengliensis]|jgi:Rrf2 family protein|uniref:RrF2 family transcriptional regulator n=1 Tax=Negadavirga shengliensis TaxID=1389218 RepID=A0ABV9SYG1_9BACT
MFSKACEYGIRAVIYIWSQSREGRKLGVKDICKEIDAPEYFTAKILQSLARQGIISSAKGPNGGFYIDKEQEELCLIDLVVAIDGEKIFKGCGLGLKLCSEKNPCPIHNDFKIVRDGLTKLLKEKTIKALADEVSKGTAVLVALS